MQDNTDTDASASVCTHQYLGFYLTACVTADTLLYHKFLWDSWQCAGWLICWSDVAVHSPQTPFKLAVAECGRIHKHTHTDKQMQKNHDENVPILPTSTFKTTQIED